MAEQEIRPIRDSRENTIEKSRLARLLFLIYVRFRLLPSCHHCFFMQGKGSPEVLARLPTAREAHYELRALRDA